MANKCLYNSLDRNLSFVSVPLLIDPLVHLGGRMKRGSVSVIGQMALVALFVLVLLPVSTFAQRRHNRSRIVIYQSRPYVVYQRRPVYTYRYDPYYYSQPYYSTGYYSSGYSPYYSSPYYTNQYYYGYTQPYVVNRYTYSPAYGYSYHTYQPRYHRNRFRLGIWLR